MDKFFLLEDRKADPSEKSSFFCRGDGIEIICQDPEDLTSSLDKIEKYRRDGKFLVGFISYEAGLLLNDENLFKLTWEDRKSVV